MKGGNIIKKTYFRKEALRKLLKICAAVLLVSLLAVGGVFLFRYISQSEKEREEELLNRLTVLEAELEEKLAGCERQLRDERLQYAAENAGSTGYRFYRFNRLTIPDNIVPGKCYDIRIVFPDGSSYTCVSCKEITEVSPDLGECTLELSEEEFVLLFGAECDMNTYRGTRLELMRYNAESGRAHVNYPPSQTIVGLLRSDPNIDRLTDAYINPQARAVLEENLEKYRGAGE